MLFWCLGPNYYFFMFMMSDWGSLYNRGDMDLDRTWLSQSTLFSCMAFFNFKCENWDQVWLRIVTVWSQFLCHLVAIYCFMAQVCVSCVTFQRRRMLFSSEICLSICPQQHIFNSKSLLVAIKAPDEQQK